MKTKSLIQIKQIMKIMEEKKISLEKNQTFLQNLSPIKEDNDESPFKLSHNRTNSLEKMHYSKKIKRYIIPKIYLPSNSKIISTPHLQNLLSAPKASINDYEKLKELGARSYANVILAKSNIDGKQFAIKVIKKTYQKTIKNIIKIILQNKIINIIKMTHQKKLIQIEEC